MLTANKTTIGIYNEMLKDPFFRDILTRMDNGETDGILEQICNNLRSRFNTSDAKISNALSKTYIYFLRDVILHPATANTSNNFIVSIIALICDIEKAKHIKFNTPANYPLLDILNTVVDVNMDANWTYNEIIVFLESVKKIGINSEILGEISYKKLIRIISNHSNMEIGEYCKCLDVLLSLDLPGNLGLTVENIQIIQNRLHELINATPDILSHHFIQVSDLLVKCNHFNILNPLLAESLNLYFINNQNRLDPESFAIFVDKLSKLGLNLQYLVHYKENLDKIHFCLYKLDSREALCFFANVYKLGYLNNIARVITKYLIQDLQKHVCALNIEDLTYVLEHFLSLGFQPNDLAEIFPTIDFYKFLVNKIHESNTYHFTNEGEVYNLKEFKTNDYITRSVWVLAAMNYPVSNQNEIALLSFFLKFYPSEEINFLKFAEIYYYFSYHYPLFYNLTYEELFGVKNFENDFIYKIFNDVKAIESRIRTNDDALKIRASEINRHLKPACLRKDHYEILRSIEILGGQKFTLVPHTYFIGNRFSVSIQYTVNLHQHLPQDVAPRYSTVTLATIDFKENEMSINAPKRNEGVVALDINIEYLNSLSVEEQLNYLNQMTQQILSKIPCNLTSIVPENSIFDNRDFLARIADGTHPVTIISRNLRKIKNDPRRDELVPLLQSVHDVDDIFAFDLSDDLITESPLIYQPMSQYLQESSVSAETINDDNKNRSSRKEEKKKKPRIRNKKKKEAMLLKQQESAEIQIEDSSAQTISSKPPLIVTERIFDANSMQPDLPSAGLAPREYSEEEYKREIELPIIADALEVVADDRVDVELTLSIKPTLKEVVQKNQANNSKKKKSAKSGKQKKANISPKATQQSKVKKKNAENDLLEQAMVQAQKQRAELKLSTPENASEIIARMFNDVRSKNNHLPLDSALLWDKFTALYPDETFTQDSESIYLLVQKIILDGNLTTNTVMDVARFIYGFERYLTKDTIDTARERILSVILQEDMLVNWLNSNDKINIDECLYICSTLIVANTKLPSIVEDIFCQIMESDSIDFATIISPLYNIIHNNILLSPRLKGEFLSAIETRLVDYVNETTKRAALYNPRYWNTLIEILGSMSIKHEDISIHLRAALFHQFVQNLCYVSEGTIHLHANVFIKLNFDLTRLPEEIFNDFKQSIFNTMEALEENCRRLDSNPAAALLPLMTIIIPALANGHTSWNPLREYEVRKYFNQYAKYMHYEVIGMHLNGMVGTSVKWNDFPAKVRNTFIETIYRNKDYLDANFIVAFLFTLKSLEYKRSNTCISLIPDLCIQLSSMALSENEQILFDQAQSYFIEHNIITGVLQRESVSVSTVGLFGTLPNNQEVIVSNIVIPETTDSNESDNLRNQSR